MNTKNQEKYINKKARWLHAELFFLVVFCVFYCGIF